MDKYICLCMSSGFFLQDLWTSWAQTFRLFANSHSNRDVSIKSQKSLSKWGGLSSLSRFWCAASRCCEIFVRGCDMWWSPATSPCSAAGQQLSHMREWSSGTVAALVRAKLHKQLCVHGDISQHSSKTSCESTREQKVTGVSINLCLSERLMVVLCSLQGFMMLWCKKLLLR